MAEAEGRRHARRRGLTKPYCYHIDQFCEFQPIIHKVIEYAEALGPRHDPGRPRGRAGQLELNFNFDRAEKTADNLSTYRQVCRQVGRELGAFPCFMPKPFMGVSANGCHHNISLWRGDENVFMPEGEDQQMPSRSACTRSAASSSTSRRSPRSPPRRSTRTGALGHRLLGAGVLRLGLPEPHHRAARVGARPLRVPLVDSAVNPYLSMAVLIKAMEDGIKRKLDPGKPEERNIYEAMQAGKDVKRIPMNFGDALDALERGRGREERATR